MYKVLTAPTPCVTRFDEEIKSFNTQKAAIAFAQACEEKNVAVWANGYMYLFLKLDGKVKHRYQGDFMGYEFEGDKLGDVTKQIKAICKEIKSNGYDCIDWHNLSTVESLSYSNEGVKEVSDRQWLAHTINNALPKAWRSTGEEVNKAFPFEL